MRERRCCNPCRRAKFVRNAQCTSGTEATSKAFGTTLVLCRILARESRSEVGNSISSTQVDNESLKDLSRAPLERKLWRKRKHGFVRLLHRLAAAGRTRVSALAIDPPMRWLSDLLVGLISFVEAKRIRERANFAQRPIGADGDRPFRSLRAIRLWS
jgi:hypothetical protein